MAATSSKRGIRAINAAPAQNEQATLQRPMERVALVAKMTSFAPLESQMEKSLEKLPIKSQRKSINEHMEHAPLQYQKLTKIHQRNSKMPLAFAANRLLLILHVLSYVLFFVTISMIFRRKIMIFFSRDATEVHSGKNEKKKSGENNEHLVPRQQ